MPTKKPKLTAKGKALKKKLEDLNERHPLKIGDPLPPDDVLLELVKISIDHTISRTALEQATFSTAEAFAEAVTKQLNLWLAGETVTQPLIGTVLVPKSWWQMFKRDVLGIVLKGDEYRDIDVKCNAMFEVVYPSLKLPKILPEVKGVLVRVRGQEPNKEYMTAGVE